MKNNITILIATHKPIVPIDNNIFKPIQVGVDANKFIINSEYILDNQDLDNISIKNKNFNELTALYWAWKNLDTNIIGLMHYRRFLDFSYKKPFFKKEKNIHPAISIDLSDRRLNYLKNESKVLKYIEKTLGIYDIICPKKLYNVRDNVYETITKQYYTDHIGTDWDKCMEILLQKYPDYSASVSKYLDNGNILYIGNMFVAPKKWFNHYCEWLFDILFELEKQITISNDTYQARVFGFLSERLFTLYILHHQFKTKELPILFIEE